uniref:Uncharacterized protein n=1 Tax=Junco hyemalis TaxID=40217 RepID=A0A8C5IL00_JUNHY
MKSRESQPLHAPGKSPPKNFSQHTLPCLSQSKLPIPTTETSAHSSNPRGYFLQQQALLSTTGMQMESTCPREIKAGTRLRFPSTSDTKEAAGRITLASACVGVGGVGAQAGADVGGQRGFDRAGLLGLHSLAQGGRCAGRHRGGGGETGLRGTAFSVGRVFRV